jgi:hypothetical protein
LLGPPPEEVSRPDPETPRDLGHRVFRRHSRSAWRTPPLGSDESRPRVPKTHDYNASTSPQPYRRREDLPLLLSKGR